MRTDPASALVRPFALGILALSLVAAGAQAQSHVHGDHGEGGHEASPTPAPIEPELTLTFEPSSLTLAAGASGHATLRVSGPPHAEIALAPTAPPGIRAALAATLIPLGPSGFAIVPVSIDADAGASGIAELVVASGATSAALPLEVAPAMLPPNEPLAPAPRPGALAALAGLAGVALLGASGRPRRRLALLLAALYSRIRPGRALDHPARRALHALIAAEPGLTLRDLQTRARLANGSFAHHLHVLERAHLVALVHEGRARRAWPAGERPPTAAPDLPSRMIDALRRRGPLRLADLAREANASPQAVHHHVKRMLAERRIAKRGAGRGATYVL